MNANQNYSALTGRPGNTDKSGFSERARQMLLWSTAITMLLWFVPGSDIALYPLRLFITFIHESGHALAAIVMEGRVVSLQISPDGSGLTQTMQSPLWVWLTLSSGYLGTTVFGALLLQIGRMPRWRNAGRATLQMCAVLMLLATIFWVRDWFTLRAALILIAMLWGLGWLLPPAGSDFLVSFLAVQCCLNALGDLRMLLYLTTNRLGDNDAVFMSRSYGLPPTFWAITWAGIAAFILFVSLRSYWRATGSRSTQPVLNR